MANKFVWSGATGANDGSSWADAYTSLMRDWGAEAGFTPATDFVYVRSIHAESADAVLTITGTTAEGTESPVRVLSVAGAATGTSPGALTAGASVSAITTTTNDVNFDERLYVYGVDFFAIDNIVLGSSTADHDIELDTCRLELTGVSTTDHIRLGSSTSSAGNRVSLNNVTMDFAVAGQGILLGFGESTWRGGSLALNVDTLVDSPSNAIKSTFRAIAVDLSVLAGGSLTFGSINVGSDSILIFERCVLGTGAIILTGTIDVPGYRVESYHCQIGTDADPSYQMEIHTSRGSVTTDTSRYRSGGASDGVRGTPISWDFSTAAGSVRGYPGHAFEGPRITAWTDGDGSTAHTYRIYFASDATINDDEIWFELYGPNDAATSSLASLKTNRVAPLTSAAAHATDSASTWNGTGVTTKQQMDITYTPDKPGVVTARVFMAKAADHIYIDPAIYIDPS